MQVQVAEGRDLTSNLLDSIVCSSFTDVNWEDRHVAERINLPTAGLLTEGSPSDLERLLGSRLIDRQSQKMTVAASAMAERNVFAHLS